MHINRKPGEQMEMEMDWAGQTVCLTDDITGEAIEAYVFVAVLSYSGYIPLGRTSCSQRKAGIKAK
jgi:hypothetical protein